MSGHGRDGCTDWQGNVVVPYSCKDDNCFNCNLMAGELMTTFDKPCPNSAAGKIVARSEVPTSAIDVDPQLSTVLASASREQVRIIICALAGFELTTQERAEIRPLYLKLIGRRL